MSNSKEKDSLAIGLVCLVVGILLLGLALFGLFSSNIAFVLGALPSGLLVLFFSYYFIKLAIEVKIIRYNKS